MIRERATLHSIDQNYKLLWLCQPKYKLA